MGATVGTSLQIFDSFSQVLDRFNSGLQKAVTVSTLLHSMLQTPITLDVDTAMAATNLAQAVEHSQHLHSSTDDLQQSVGILNERMNVIPIMQQKMISHQEQFNNTLVTSNSEIKRMIGTMTSFRSLQNHTEALPRSHVIDITPIHVTESTIPAVQDEMIRKQELYSTKVGESHKKAEGLSKVLKEVMAAYLGIEGIQKGIEFIKWSDEIASTNSRLGMMNDGTQTQLQLQQKVMKVANDTRQAYAETANMVAQLGSSTQGVFKTNTELLDFTSRFNKLLATGGANAEESKSAILQMTQALASGVLQGDELRSLSETAPMLMKVLADGLGVSRGSLKQLGAQGKLTSEAVVQAFAKEDTYINKLFSKMPVTFSQAMTIGKNKAVEWIATINGANGPVHELTQSLMGLMNSRQGEGFLDGITVGIRLAADASAWFIGLITNHMDIVKNVLIGVGVVLAVLAAEWFITWAAAALPILAIMGAIALVVTVLNRFGVSTQMIVGFVAGLFTMMFATVKNQIGLFWNEIVSFAEFFANIFVDPVYAVKKLFYDLSKNAADYFSVMINGLITGLNWLISKINSLSGTEIKMINEFKSEGLLDNFKPTTNKDVFDFDKYKIDFSNPIDAFKVGQQYGSNLFDKMTNALDGIQQKGDAWNVDKVNEVGKIGDTVDISSEDLKAMRDLAEMKSIQNFVTLTPTVQVTGDIHNHNTGEVEDMLNDIVVALQTHMDSSMDGVI